ncbi:hypothetical protein EDL96_06460 [Kocuria soli]|uniref:ABC-type glycine betaine transport system substrate-binding domain-containing protein n=1 Tax=Kocuria soli TaxID=2485125 RepID=A0A3N3ZQS2_9MICC|nr:glycine betaine ABC transporter substrate-binding protein [Kocuria soli]ROZ63562.1 hypothetical protein EDL96_06460 [Kocuria soli]
MRPQTGRAAGSRPPLPGVIAAALAAVTLTLAGCDGDQPTNDPTATAEASAPRVVVGAGPTNQTETVAYAWSKALEDAGMTVEVREIEGGRAGYLKAVEDGEIDVFPDYSGDLYLELRGNQPQGAGTVEAQEPTQSPSSTTVPSDEANGSDENIVDTLADMLGSGQEGVTDGDVESGVDEQLPETVQILDAAPAENKRVLATTAATAARLEVTSIDDLAEHCGDLTFGAIKGEDQASVTAAAVADTYECTPGEVREFDSQADVVQALLEGQIDVAGVLSATPAIEDNSLEVLEDNQEALVPERVLPVASADLSDQAVSEINGISGQLDTEALVLLTRMTTSSTPYTPEEAADYWYGTVRP